MSARYHLHSFVRCARGASAAEFALVLPIFLLFLIGIIDAGRFLYEVNRGEKATQIGARMAVVTAPLAPQLSTQSFVGQTVAGVPLAQGDRIPLGAIGTITCDEVSCSAFGHDPNAFSRIFDRMQQIMPSIQRTNLIIEYSDSGLGYAGNPNGMDIAPLVTVRLTGLNFAPTFLFGAQVPLPDFAYTLTMEDGQGATSN